MFIKHLAALAAMALTCIPTALAAPYLGISNPDNVQFDFWNSPKKGQEHGKWISDRHIELPVPAETGYLRFDVKDKKGTIYQVRVGRVSKSMPIWQAVFQYSHEYSSQG
jgi:hypothetical protein